MDNQAFYHQCIKKLMKEYNFSELFRDPEYAIEWLTDKKRNALEEDGYFIDSGATRIVIGHEDWDFVFKFLYDWSDDIDYCANELFIYNEAKKEGLSDYFAKCEYVGMYYATPIYAMERCDCDSDQLSSESYRTMFKKWCAYNDRAEDDEVAQEEFYNESDYDCDDQEGMLELAEDYWGWAETNRMIDFMDRYVVNDCHAGNWGKIDSQLVIVDYAGYSDCAKMIQEMRLGA